MLPSARRAITRAAALALALARLASAAASPAAQQIEGEASPRAVHERATALVAQGDLAGALAAYDSLLARLPDHRPAQAERASVLRAMGRLDEAERALEGLLAATGDARVRIDLAALRVELGDLDGARAELSLAADDAAAPAVVRALASYQLGLLAARQDGDSAAVAALEEAVRLDPQLLEARVELATALARRGDYAAAATRYREALETDPRHLVSRLGLVTSLVLASRHREARDVLVEGLRARPGEPNLTHALAHLLAASPDLALRDGQRALELAQAAFEKTGRMEHGETVALAYAEMGAFDEATRWQRKLLAEAERLGDAAWIDRLSAGLARYEREERP